MKYPRCGVRTYRSLGGKDICVQLTLDNRCRLYGRPEQPAVCVRLRPDEEMCGKTAEHAMAWLLALEEATRPVP